MARRARNTVPARRPKIEKQIQNLTIVIPAAAAGKRMKTFGSRSLVPMRENKNLIQHQVAVLSSTFPDARICVVVGFESERVIPQIPNGVSVVFNEKYEDTGIVQSIGKGVLANPSHSLLIVNGDLAFNDEVFENVDTNRSCVLIHDEMAEEEIGCVVVKNRITNFSFGLSPKWGQITYLIGKEFDLFQDVMFTKQASKIGAYEALNNVINKNGNLQAFYSNGKLIEIDSSKDMELALRI